MIYKITIPLMDTFCIEIEDGENIIIEAVDNVENCEIVSVTRYDFLDLLERKIRDREYFNIEKAMIEVDSYIRSYEAKGFPCETFEDQRRLIERMIEDRRSKN